MRSGDGFWGAVIMISLIVALTLGTCSFQETVRDRNAAGQFLNDPMAKCDLVGSMPLKGRVVAQYECTETRYYNIDLTEEVRNDGSATK